MLDALATFSLDAIAPERRAQLAQGLLLTLQGHRHRAATTLHQDAAQARLPHLISFWRLVLDMACIERDYAPPPPGKQDIDGALLVKLSGTARAIASNLDASTLAHLSGLDEMLPTIRAPIASLH